MLNRSDLTPSQLQTIDHVKSTPRCAAWVPMGHGKTVSALTAFSDLLESFDARRMLVTAPLRVARDVWHAEVEEWAHLRGLTVSRIVGSRSQRLAAYRKPADIHTVNREQLDWLFRGHVEELGPSRFKQVRRWPWDVFTMDEAQSFKNASSNRTLAAHRISTFGLSERIVELTGTPASNGYANLWSQLFILDHGRRLGVSETAFLERWFNPPPVGEYRWRIKAGAAEEIQALIADIVLSIPDSNPPLPINEVRIQLPAKVLKDYQRFQREALLALQGEIITAANAGAVSNKLLQMASGFVYTEDKRGLHLHDEKFGKLADMLDELAFSGPVLIAYNFVEERERIGAFLNRYCSVGQRWSPLKSERHLQEFASGYTDFGIIHPASGGHGLNSLYKSGAKNIVWLGPTPDLELFQQLNARLAGGHRRSDGVGLHVLLAEGTVDLRYMQMLHDKDMDQTGLVRALVRSVL